MKLPEYEATKIAKNVFLQFDYENQDVPGKEYIELLECTSPFADKLKERATALGYTGNLTDTEKLRAFLFLLLQEEPGIIDEKNARAWKENLRNWLVPKKDSTTPLMPGKREFVYQLCFALKMNALEAGEFFVKGYLERPYNFKNLKETAYFYCLNNGLHYADAMDLYQKAKDIPFEKNKFAETDTASIGRIVSEFHNEESFMDYIRENRWSFETGSVSAKKRISQLIELCMPYATKDYNTFNFSERQEAIARRDISVENDDGKDKNKKYEIKPVAQKTISNAETLLSVIYGYYARETRIENGKAVPIYKKTLNKDSHFPKLIRERMVSNAMQLSALQKGSAPDALIRSALILFSFYYFFSNARENGCTDTSELFGEFVDEVDAVLWECGHGQLYWRNPYDWMIGYCAKSSNPVEQLRILIDEFFLDDEAIYT